MFKWLRQAAGKKNASSVEEPKVQSLSEYFDDTVVHICGGKEQPQGLLGLFATRKIEQDYQCVSKSLIHSCLDVSLHRGAVLENSWEIRLLHAIDLRRASIGMKTEKQVYYQPGDGGKIAKSAGVLIYE